MSDTTNSSISNIKIIKKCNHLNNNVQVYAECCKKYYDCHLCHNEVNDHRLIKYTIKKVKCTNCSTENCISDNCRNCKIKFGENNCRTCNIWCNKTKFFHCYKCKFCGIGNKEDFFHCDSCNICVSSNTKNKHVCNNKIANQKEEVCPICLLSIFFPLKKAVLLKCNHLIHEDCLNELIKNTDQNKKIPCCTLCKKSVVVYQNYEEKFDKIKNECMLLNYYKGWKAQISCNDCSKRSTTKYHNIYNKCEECKSYNTTILNVIKS